MLKPLASSNSITESINPDTTAIDTLSPLEIVTMINREDMKVAQALQRELTRVAKAASIVEGRLRRGGRLLYFGAGTSGRLGVLDASEIPPTFNASPKMVQGFIAGGDAALRKAVEAAEDNREDGVRLVASLDVDEKDAVVGITASGGAPWVLGVVAEARRRGAVTIGVTCNPEGPLQYRVDVNIAPVVGPEVIAGSTRMKAGTAQKMALNMLSTAVMIRLGKVYGNLMVDVAATNDKLRLRAKGIVQQVCDVDEETARTVLQQTDYRVKPALVMLLAGVEASAAMTLLEQTDGVVREALALVANAGSRC